MANQVKESLYMDNIQGTANNYLIKFYKIANRIIMPEAYMPLEEWV